MYSYSLNGNFHLFQSIFEYWFIAILFILEHLHRIQRKCILAHWSCHWCQIFETNPENANLFLYSFYFIMKSIVTDQIEIPI